MKKMYIVLEDGHIFEGKGYGATGEAVGELVFTTGVVGYIEQAEDARRAPLLGKKSKAVALGVARSGV